MLATTVSYLSLLETKRHNVKTESQQDTQLGINQQLANIKQGELDETKRHNAATEAFSWSSLAETQRHNVVSESINMYDAATRRINSDISKFEAQTHRYSAVQSAGIGWANVAVNQGNLAVAQSRASNDYEIGLLNAKANVKNAETNVKKQEEEVRYHDLWSDVQSQSNENSAVANSIKSQQLDWDKEIQSKKYELEKTDRYWRDTLETIDTASSLFHNIVEDVSSAADTLRPDSKYIKKRKKGK